MGKIPLMSLSITSMLKAFTQSTCIYLFSFGFEGFCQHRGACSAAGWSYQVFKSKRLPPYNSQRGMRSMNEWPPLSPLAQPPQIPERSPRSCFAWYLGRTPFELSPRCSQQKKALVTMLFFPLFSFKKKNFFSVSYSLWFLRSPPKEITYIQILFSAFASERTQTNQMFTKFI